MQMIDNCKPELIRRIVHFRTRFFNVAGQQYEIIGTEALEADCLHTVKNLSTGQIKEIHGMSIYEWFKKLKK